MITFLLTLVVATVLLVTLLTFTIFCYEETNRTGQPLGRFLALAGRTVARSIVSECLIVVLHPMGLWPGLWSAPTEGKSLVVLVHGLFHNPGAWVLFRRRLRARGHGAACFGYASWGTEWETAVEGLRAYLDDLLRAHPGRDVHLVGHSMGGLLLRAALPKLADDRAVRSLVTLGTPYGGSKLSPFALTSLGRYLGHKGETVRAVAALPVPPHIRYLALRSPADNMVLPNDALRCGLPGCEERETAPVSHVAMIHSRSVFEEVLGWIEATPRRDD